jgi:hypothetical protein
MITQVTLTQYHDQHHYRQHYHHHHHQHYRPQFLLFFPFLDSKIKLTPSQITHGIELTSNLVTELWKNSCDFEFCMKKTNLILFFFVHSFFLLNLMFLFLFSSSEYFSPNFFHCGSLYSWLFFSFLSLSSPFSSYSFFLLANRTLLSHIGPSLESFCHTDYKYFSVTQDQKQIVWDFLAECTDAGTFYISLQKTKGDEI